MKGLFGEQGLDSNNFCFADESTHDSLQTSSMRTSPTGATAGDMKPQEIVYQAKNPFDLDEIINNEDKLQRLLQEIDFNPTGKKRLRLKKNQKVEKNQPVLIIRKVITSNATTSTSLNSAANDDTNERSHNNNNEEENKRRKNKE